jgi:predicted dehydrogenase
LRLSVLVVGCGNIAGGFDRGRAASDWPYTHAGAYRRDGRFDLVACVEPDGSRRQTFMDDWSVAEGFASMAEVREREMAFDIISICSPTACHAADLAMALDMRPKAVFCEKPIASSLSESEGLVARYREARLPLAVGYTRRWDPEVNRLRAEIATGKWGVLRSATAIYNKGISNNGSHMLDLLHFLVGPLSVVCVGEAVADYLETDLSIPAWLVTSSSAPVHLACGHAADYTIFELQLVFSEGVLSMEEGGQFWRERHATDSDLFIGYRVLGAGIRRTGGDHQAMTAAAANLYQAVVANEPLASTGDTALAALRLCNEIERSAAGLRSANIYTSNDRARLA